MEYGFSNGERTHAYKGFLKGDLDDSFSSFTFPSKLRFFVDVVCNDVLVDSYFNWSFNDWADKGGYWATYVHDTGYNASNKAGCTKDS